MTPRRAESIGLALSVLLDAVFLVLFFVDGRADEAAYLQREFADYSVTGSVADLLLLCAFRDIGLVIAYRSVGVVRSAVPAIVRPRFRFVFVFRLTSSGSSCAC